MRIHTTKFAVVAIAFISTSGAAFSQGLEGDVSRLTDEVRQLRQTIDARRAQPSGLDAMAAAIEARGEAVWQIEEAKANAACAGEPSRLATRACINNFLGYDPVEINARRNGQ